LVSGNYARILVGANIRTVVKPILTHFMSVTLSSVTSSVNSS